MLKKRRTHFLILMILLSTVSMACRLSDIYSDLFIDVLESNFGADLLYGDDTQQDTSVQVDANVQTQSESQEDTIGEEAIENASEPVDEIVSDPANENDNEPASESEFSIEACVAQPDEYAWEFANVNNEGSNDTKEVCQGDFFVRNTSNRILHVKWFQYWDNGAMQDIGWEALCQRLKPGEAFTQNFGTQTLSTGNISETVATFTQLIVFYDLPDCVGFLLDKENETLWDEFAIPLSDPCR